MKRISLILVIIVLALVGCKQEPPAPAPAEKAKPKEEVPPPETHIFFTGLVTFLREQDKPVVAMAPKVSRMRADYVDQAGKHPVIPEHRPFLVIDTKKNRFASGTTPQRVGDFAIFWLDDSDLQILDQKTQPLQWNESRDYTNCGTPPDTKSVIPNIGKFCDCNGSPMFNEPNMRIEVSNGSSYGFVLAKYASEFKKKYNDNPVWRQRLAQLVEWNVPLTGKALVFTRSSISGGGARTHFLTVYPSDDADRRIVVVMGNADPDALVSVLGGNCIAMDPDYHFEAYYRRCHKVNNGKPIPHKGGPCDSDTLEAWTPQWLQNCVGIIPGSVNCGPDQLP
jgi:hypothetical protein